MENEKMKRTRKWGGKEKGRVSSRLTNERHKNAASPGPNLQPGEHTATPHSRRGRGNRKKEMRREGVGLDSIGRNPRSSTRLTERRKFTKRGKRIMEV